MTDKNQDPRFADLFERYYRAVHSLFLRRGFSSEDARDLTQTTFLRVFKGMEHYRGDAEWSWIVRIANHVGHNELRYRQAARRTADTISLDALESLPRTAQENPMTGAEPKSPLDDVLDREDTEIEEQRLQLLREAIDELPPGDRRCLLMRVNGGHKYRVIAKTMNISMDTVKSRLYRARNRLKEKLGEHYAELDRLKGEDGEEE